MSRPRLFAPAVVRLKMLAAACALLLAGCSPPPAGDPLVEPALSWVRQFPGGFESMPIAQGLAVDAVGNSYVVGSMLAKFGPDGAQQWVRDLPLNTRGEAVAVAPSGGAYFTGWRTSEQGSWLEKRDAFGNEVWRAPLTNPDNFVRAKGVAVTPSGDVVVTGGWWQGPSLGENPVAFLATYSSRGAQKSLALLPFPFDGVWANEGWDVAVDALGGVYLSGFARRSVADTDDGKLDYAFVAKYDLNGNQVWVERFDGGLGSIFAFGVAANAAADRVCVTGWLSGVLDGQESAGFFDAFVVCYDTSGTRLWMRQFGTEERDIGEGIAMDEAGNVFVAGTTEGTFGTSLGGLLGGGTDAFLARYDRQGVQTHVWEFGTLEADRGYGVAADGAGNVYVTGNTWGSMWVGPVPGAFLVKLEGF